MTFEIQVGEPTVPGHAVFDTYRNLRHDPAAYRQARDAAIAAVVAKEREYDL